uniref:Histone-lysine N-methyltransferase, H3 lysine-79 specific n=1 Tax=Ditylenchus dipsaci TaxID=166011 RepID=A0A915DEH9_9BILA
MLPLEMLKFVRGASANKFAGMAGQIIFNKYPEAVGQKCVQQSRSFSLNDVEPNKKKMIQDLPVSDHIKIALLLIDELTENKNKAEVKALKTEIGDLTEAKNKAESELLQARKALFEAAGFIKENKIAKPKVTKALHSNKQEEHVAYKPAEQTQQHSKVDQLVNCNMVQEMLDYFEWRYLKNCSWQDSLQDSKFVHSLKEAGVSRPYVAEDIAQLLKNHFVQQIEDVAGDLRFQSGEILKVYDNFETEDQKKLLSFVAEKQKKPFCKSRLFIVIAAIILLLLLLLGVIGTALKQSNDFGTLEAVAASTDALKGASQGSNSTDGIFTEELRNLVIFSLDHLVIFRPVLPTTMEVANGTSATQAMESSRWRTLIFYFNSSQVDKNNIAALELLDAVRLAMNHFPELNTVIQNYCKLEEIDAHSYSELRSLTKKFNKAATTMSQMLKTAMTQPGIKLEPEDDGLASKEVLRQLITRSYNKAVDNEKALNKHYEAFSSQTYGETSFDRMQMILDELKPKDKDVFVDLGSGVGQLVIHAAGGSLVQKAIGIEVAALPAKFAKTLEKEFKKWMSWFGKKHQPFELQQGDFLDDKYRNLIMQEATIIFINNFAFQSDLETRIKQELLSELNDGNERHANDISIIMDVCEMKQCPNPCSWTSAYVPYYMHVINRAKLQRYFDRNGLRNSTPRARAGSNDRRSSTPSSKASNSRESTNVSNGIGVDFGPTTRRKWHEYVSEIEQQKQKNKGHPDEEYATPPSTSAKDSMFTLSDNHSPQSTSTNEFSFDPMNSPVHNEKGAHLTNTSDISEQNTTEEDSSPIKKKVKRSYEKKDKHSSSASNRGRPRKADKIDDLGHFNHSNHKNPRLSDEAKEGIELMHEMTKAVTGANHNNGLIDPLQILADLTNQRNKKASTGSNHRMEGLPFPDLSSDGAIASTSNSSLALPPALSNGCLDTNVGKYPSLDKFLYELRQLYENFLDSIPARQQQLQTPQKMSAEQPSPMNVDSKDLLLKVDLTEMNHFKQKVNTTTNLLERIQAFDRQHQGSPLAERSKIILEHHKRVRTKCAELESEIAVLNAETELLLNDYQQREEQQRILQEQQQQLAAAAQQQAAFASVQQQAQQLAAQQQAQQQLFPQGSVGSIGQLVLSDIAHHYSSNLLTSHPQPNIATLHALAGVANSVANLHSPIANAAAQPANPSINHSPIAPSSANQQTQQMSVQNFLNNLDLSSLNAGNVAAVAAEFNLNNSLSALHKQQQRNQMQLVANIQPTVSSVSINSALVSSSTPAQAQHTLVDNDSNHQQSSQSSSSSSVAAVVAAVASGNGAKKSRSRPSKATPAAAKRSAQSVKLPEDPVKNEEIERQIQVIVAKALEVDSAAKCAEKREKRGVVGKVDARTEPHFYYYLSLRSYYHNFNPFQKAKFDRFIRSNQLHSNTIASDLNTTFACSASLAAAQLLSTATSNTPPICITSVAPLHIPLLLVLLKRSLSPNPRSHWPLHQRHCPQPFAPPWKVVLLCIFHFLQEQDWKTVTNLQPLTCTG